MARFLGGEEIELPPPPKRYRCPKGHEVEIPMGWNPKDPAVVYGFWKPLPVLRLNGEDHWRCKTCMSQAYAAWLKKVAPIMEEVQDATN